MTLRIMPPPVKPATSESVEVEVPTKPMPVKPKEIKPKPVKQPEIQPKPKLVAQGKSQSASQDIEKYEPKDAEPVVETQVPSQSVLVETPSFRVKPTPPHYPRMAKRKGQQGTVIIEVWLDKNGKQIQRLIAESSGFEALDNAAMSAVMQWQFKGHSINGQNIESRLKVPVRFELN